jgi:glycosyltransferase involved in cell wall biosynthesis
LIGGLFRWSAEKRPLLWLDVAALLARRLPAARFLLFGEGPLGDAMQRHIDAGTLGHRIQLLPPTAEVALALSAFDLLLLTSEWEGTPNVAIEAQAVGTPVVLTGGGGAREAIAEGTSGVYVEAPEAPAMADAVATLLGAQRGLPAREAMTFVQHRFAMARMLARTRSLYEV